jgi:acylphosphatase
LRRVKRDFGRRHTACASHFVKGRWPVQRKGVILEESEKPQMEPHEQAQRREVHYSGRVQGVGFRYTVRALARQFAVTGYVKNLPDGRVELVVEGDAEEIRAMLRAIRVEMGHYVRDVRETPSRASGGFSGFEVRF